MDEWFKIWFNSKYYHILYSNRNDKEAEHFLDNLCINLKIKPDSKILDLACGAGRHAKYLSKKEMDVIGIDISEFCIDMANNFKNKKLNFYIHDMRSIFYKNYFDYVFNFFTSFGYFENYLDQIKTIKNVHNSLKKNGIFVIDFLNSEIIKNENFEKEIFTIDGIEFEINKEIKENFITKNICIKDKGEKYNYIEKVKLLELEDFNNYFKEIPLRINNIFGDYNFKEFDKNKSSRLILICEKYE